MSREAAQRKYYLEHREQLLEKAKEIRERRKAEGKTAKQQYDKNSKSATQKRWLKPFKEKYKGFQFKFDGDVLTIEVKLPYRITVTDKWNIKHCDDDTIYNNQCELRRKIAAIYKSKHLVIMDCNTCQLYLSKVDEQILDQICTITRDYIKEKLEKYGQYVKRGFLVGAEFE